MKLLIGFEAGSSGFEGSELRQFVEFHVGFIGILLFVKLATDGCSTRQRLEMRFLGKRLAILDERQGGNNGQYNLDKESFYLAILHTIL